MFRCNVTDYVPNVTTLPFESTLKQDRNTAAVLYAFCSCTVFALGLSCLQKAIISALCKVHEGQELSFVCCALREGKKKRKNEKKSTILLGGL